MGLPQQAMAAQQQLNAQMNALMQAQMQQMMSTMMSTQPFTMKDKDYEAAKGLILETIEFYKEES